MQNHRTHQIDSLAQLVFGAAIPATWVRNEQRNDYGKDYLVEIGEDNGNLTGGNFYVQLKGQEIASMSGDGTLVKYALESKHKYALESKHKYALESKHAQYYLDKIKDLPVFLVVVDINEKKGRWLFLQPFLDANQDWRKQGSITVSIPVGNELTDTVSLRDAVNKAKKWMRLHHPESIHETVIAHKERVARIDPRFDVAVSLVNDTPQFSLLAKEDVSLTFKISGDPQEINKKVNDLLDRGDLVAFGPGEINVIGSKLFENAGEIGCFLQAATNLSGTLTITCRDANGSELARLTDLPGRYTGGRKQLMFKGELANSPLSINVGPISANAGGVLQLNLNLHKWDGQSIHRLAYFDRIFQFFHALPNIAETEIDCQQDGNQFFAAKLPAQEQEFAVPVTRYLGILSRARRVAEHFNVDAKWSVDAFHQDTQETAEALYAIFFGDGWAQLKPNVQVQASCLRSTFRFDALEKAEEPGLVRLVSKFRFVFFGEESEVGRLVREYTEMSIKLVNKRRPLKKVKRKRKDQGNKVKKLPLSRTVDIALIGSKNTVMRITRDDKSFSDTASGLSLICGNTNVKKT